MINVDEKMNITLTKGDSASLSLSLKDGDSGDDYDYSNDDVKFVVKRSQQDSEVVLEKTVEDGQIVLKPEDTNTIEGFGDFLYAIKVYHEAESADDEPVIDVYTPIVARFTLGYNVIN